MCLLESIKPTQVGDAGILCLDLIGDPQDGSDLDEGGGDDLAVKDRLAEVARGLRAENPPLRRLRHGLATVDIKTISSELKIKSWD